MRSVVDRNVVMRRMTVVLCSTSEIVMPIMLVLWMVGCEGLRRLVTFGDIYSLRNA